MDRAARARQVIIVLKIGMIHIKGTVVGSDAQQERPALRVRIQLEGTVRAADTEGDGKVRREKKRKDSPVRGQIPGSLLENIRLREV